MFKLFENVRRSNFARSTARHPRSETNAKALDRQTKVPQWAASLGKRLEVEGY